jgi:hypothetical protein
MQQTLTCYHSVKFEVYTLFLHCKYRKKYSTIVIEEEDLYAQ